MRLVIRPVQDPTREVDLKHRLISAIAEELWRLYGGNEHLNWLEAEMHFGRIIESMRADVSREAIEEAQAAGRAEARREAETARHLQLLMVARMHNRTGGFASRDQGDFGGTRRRADDTPGRTSRSSQRDAPGRLAKVRSAELIGAT